ncbi:MAG: fibronectin type III domain-containing protein [Synergistaceae bacterium]|nr:fibronectin type III domain-containing protein [Synergistaceae bacterium]
MARGDVALADDLAIPSGKTLVVPNGAKLSVPGGVTLTIEEGAALDNQGTIINRGTIIGTVSGNPPKTPPGQPSGVVAVPGDSCATVTFAPPGDGNCPITGYTVKSDPGGVSVTGNSASVIVNGLANGTAYTFTVSAANGVGTGPISAPSPAVTPKGAQGPPSAPVVAKKTATNVTLRETEGAEYGMSSGGPWQKAPAFGGLFPNTEYNFFARLAETATHNASPSSGALTLMTDAMAGVALEESLRLATKDMPDVSVAPSGVSGDALRVIEEKLGRDAKPIATVHGAVFKPTLKPAFAATNEAFGIEGDFFRAVAQSLAVEIPLGGADGNVFAVELEVSLSGRPSFEAWGSLSDEERVALLDAHGMLFAYEFANRWRPLVGAHSGVGWDAARRVGIVRLTPTGVALSCAVTDSEGEPYAAGETIVVPDGSGDETIVDPMWLLERAKTSETEKTSASSGGGCETGATGLALAALVPALTRNRHRKRK